MLAGEKKQQKLNLTEIDLFSIMEGRDGIKDSKCDDTDYQNEDHNMDDEDRNTTPSSYKLDQVTIR